MGTYSPTHVVLPSYRTFIINIIKINRPVAVCLFAFFSCPRPSPSITFLIQARISRLSILARGNTLNLYNCQVLT